MGAIIGYARTALEESNIGLQKAALLQAGCEMVLEETCSGILPLAERTGLVKQLGNLQPGDTLVVCNMARLSRSHPCLMMILSDLQKREVNFRVRNRAGEFAGLDLILNSTSSDLDAFRRLDQSRRIKRRLTLAKKAGEKAA